MTKKELTIDKMAEGLMSAIDEARNEPWAALLCVKEVVTHFM